MPFYHAFTDSKASAYYAHFDTEKAIIGKPTPNLSRICIHLCYYVTACMSVDGLTKILR